MQVLETLIHSEPNDVLYGTLNNPTNSGRIACVLHTCRKSSIVSDVSAKCLDVVVVVEAQNCMSKVVVRCQDPRDWTDLNF